MCSEADHDVASASVFAAAAAFSINVSLFVHDGGVASHPQAAVLARQSIDLGIKGLIPPHFRAARRRVGAPYDASAGQPSVDGPSSTHPQHVQDYRAVFQPLAARMRTARPPVPDLCLLPPMSKRPPSGLPSHAHSDPKRCRIGPVQSSTARPGPPTGPYPSPPAYYPLPGYPAHLAHPTALADANHGHQVAFAGPKGIGGSESAGWVGGYPLVVPGSQLPLGTTLMAWDGHITSPYASPTGIWGVATTPACTQAPRTQSATTTIGIAPTQRCPASHARRASPASSACSASSDASRSCSPSPISGTRSTVQTSPHPEPPPADTTPSNGQRSRSTSSPAAVSSAAASARSSQRSTLSARVEEVEDGDDEVPGPAHAPPMQAKTSHPNQRVEDWDKTVAAGACPDATEEEERIVVETDLGDFDDIMDRVEDIMNSTMNEFPDGDADDPLARMAHAIAKQSITDSTRQNHLHIIKAYILFHLRRDSKWNPTLVTEKTPRDITMYIAQKCGPVSEGYEGRKFSTAVSTRAALTLWYRSLRPNESLNEWRFDEVTEIWSVSLIDLAHEWLLMDILLLDRRGLPTRSPFVARFMVGLEKTKAKSGEISHSARALRLEDMHRLYERCIAIPANDLANAKTDRERDIATQAYRSGVIRYAAYLLAWLMLLRVDEVVNLEFENVDHIPKERKYFDVRPKTRKTAQTGVGHPWRLHGNDKDPRICPVRAMMRLAMVYDSSGVAWSGPMFLQVTAAGAIDQARPLTSSVLSRGLTKDLQKLGYGAWALYGTHSFRRGGCQYRVEVKGWPIAKVAAWGGWSLVEATTMFRYFYSPDDNHEMMHDYDRND
uniref:Tyr recombinase domain-containing protein n=1 Tax=Mycena chlorophos TaxID=658473 RepID=A0ABQ0KTY2_MYCCL|nr:predicted protein [Mycena chlorophos]